MGPRAAGTHCPPRRSSTRSPCSSSSCRAAGASSLDTELTAREKPGPPDKASCPPGRVLLWQCGALAACHRRPHRSDHAVNRHVVARRRPVAATPTERNMQAMFSHILVALDGTTDSSVVLAPARTLAEATGATMTLMTVIETITSEAGHAGAIAGLERHKAALEVGGLR